MASENFPSERSARVSVGSVETSAPVCVFAGPGEGITMSDVAFIPDRFAGRTVIVTGAGSYKGQGVRANVVAPGAVATNIEAPWRSQYAQGVLGPIIGVTVTGAATSEQVAATITWLLSDDASNVNGAIVACDGGWSVI